MKITGILFDVNGTLIDILTDEGKDDIYRAIGCFLAYQGLDIPPNTLRETYFRSMEEQRKQRGRPHPEFDAIKLWSTILDAHTDALRISVTKRRQLPRILAEIFRALSRIRLNLYPDVRSVLDQLSRSYRMAVVSDGQSAWALPELRETGINGYFDPIVVSGDHGFRKPDRRLFDAGLLGMKQQPENVVFVGNDIYRDIYGARRAGMKTVLFKSNQGRQEMEGVEPDYIIYQFKELPQAIAFLEQNH